jgi:hypothetical protein
VAAGDRKPGENFSALRRTEALTVFAGFDEMMEVDFC